jgi:hypothetical protein
MLEVFYDDDKTRVNNQYLKPSGPPSTIKYPFQSGKMYTLIMHDPDAPVGNVIHWVVVNMTSTSMGEEVKKYRGPAPPPGSGIHRYIFLLYEQEEEEETGREIEIPNVVPMEELLELLKLQGSRLLSTKQFTSSSRSEGGKSRRRKKSRKKKNGSLRKKKNGSSTLYPNPNRKRKYSVNPNL